MALDAEVTRGGLAVVGDVANAARKPVRRTQQQRRLATETRLLDAATSLIAGRGSRAVSLAEVGRLAGYSSGIVSHHFGSKQQLLAAVVRRAQQFEVPRAEGHGLDQVRQLVVAYLQNLRDRAPSGQAFLLLWSEAVAGEESLGSIFAERDAWFRGLIAGYFRRGIDDGSVVPDLDPDAMAVVVTAMVRGIAIQLMSRSTDLPCEATIVRAADRVLLSSAGRSSS